ncbi:MAG: ABC transporter permease [Acidobacteriaceae bacterium]|nr:ABC transporter permease [Acidobacteriaceae bacterium]MBV9778962.1 ABC transporter permease [Acidobacteriaceae bacterium]
MDLRDPRLLWLTLYGRLKPGISLDQARTRIETIWPHVQEATRPPGYEGARLARFFARRIHTESAERGVSDLRKKFSASLWILQLLVSAILLITCLNLTNLSLAKAITHQHESGVRAALGADVWVLLRQPVIESFLLSLAGSVFGLLPAHWTSRALIAIAWTGLTPLSLSTSPDWRVLSFTAAVAIFTALLIAIAPAWYAARMEPIDVLKRTSRSILGKSAIFGKLLLTGQMTLSVVVVASALLLGRSLLRLLHTDAGYQRDHFLTILLFPQSKSGSGQDSSAYYKELSRELGRLPGVEAVSFSVTGPASEEEWLDPVSKSPTERPIQVDLEGVGPNFFRVAGMHVLSGREFRWQDYARGTEVAIISQSLAEHLFGKADSVGRVVYLGPVPYAEKLEILGVVNSASLWKIESSRPLAIYRFLRDISLDSEITADIRTTVDPHTIKSQAERIVRMLGRHYHSEP